MFKNLEGKKLLILGGVRMLVDFVLRAKKMGLCVYVADYNETGPAKEVADVPVLMDATDVDAIVKFCREEKIDGVTTGYVDILMPVCRKVCNELNIPYYATDELIEVSTDKVAFKEMCKKYDLPIPKSYNIKKEQFKEEAARLEYPVFVKPLDASGSRGAGVCFNKNEFIKQYEEALSFSSKQEVIVEEYLTGTDFLLDYLLVDGEVYLLSMFDRKMCKNRASAINHSNLLIAPSYGLENYVANVNPKVVNMCKEMGFTDGIIFLQGYIDGEKITFFEMGCRLGGSFPSVDEYYIGINPTDMLIHHAITGEMINKEYCHKITPYFKGVGGVVNLLADKTSGKVACIKGFEEIKSMPQVVNFIQYMQEGDEFESSRFTDCPIAIVHIATKNFQDYVEVVNKIYSVVDVLDDKGESLLMPVYDTKELSEKQYVSCY